MNKLMDDMIETMHDAPGIGLAAIQIAEPIRLLVVDVARKDEPPQPQAFVNPQIVWRSDERSTYEEGCLSIPEYYAEVDARRPCASASSAATGSREVLAEGLLATVLQHEIDHLDGVLFIDHISKLKRDRVIKKFQKSAKRADGGSTCLRRRRDPENGWRLRPQENSKLALEMNKQRTYILATALPSAAREREARSRWSRPRNGAGVVVCNMLQRGKYVLGSHRPDFSAQVPERWIPAPRDGRRSLARLPLAANCKSGLFHLLTH